MAAILLKAPIIASLKSALSTSYFYDIKSAHLSEALARAMGFKTNRSLLAAVEQAQGALRIAPLDDSRFVARLAKLGYANQPDPEFDGVIGKHLETDAEGFNIPPEELLRLGSEQADLYFFCISLQESGAKLPGYLSFASIESMLKRSGLRRSDGFFNINPRDYMRLTSAFDETTDDLPLAPPKTTDDFIGTVSFRADAPDDTAALFDILRARYPDAWRQTNGRESDGTAVEMKIANPLTIRVLHELMRQIEDGHIMVETLRALPLKRNNLERRYSNARPRDWSSLDDDDLVEEDNRL